MSLNVLSAACADGALEAGLRKAGYVPASDSKYFDHVSAEDYLEYVVVGLKDAGDEAAKAAAETLLARLKTKTGGSDTYSSGVLPRQKQAAVLSLAKFLAKITIGPSEKSPTDIKSAVALLTKYFPSAELINMDSGTKKPQVVATCRALAKEINRQVGSQIIPSDASDAECQAKVGEYVAVLTAGMNVELLAVAGDLKRIQKNMELLKEFMHDAFTRAVGDGGKPQPHAQAFFKALSQEMDRQQALLAGLMGDVYKSAGTAVKSIEAGDRRVRDLAQMLAVGDDKSHRDFLAQLIMGVSDAAQTASLMGEVFQKGKFSEVMKKMKSVSKPADFQKLVSDYLGEGASDNVDESKLLRLASRVEKGDYGSIQDVQKYLKGLERSAVTGGADDDEGDESQYWRRRSLKSRIKQTKDKRGVLFGLFHKNLDRCYHELIAALGKLNKSAKKSIKRGEELDAFLDAIEKIKLDKDGLTVILTGYLKDRGAQTERETFLSILKHARVTTKAAGSANSAMKGFAGVDAAISKIIAAIEEFSAKFVKGLTEIKAETPEESAAKVRGLVGAFFVKGGVEGDDNPLAARFVTLDTVVRNLRYFSRLGSMHSNLELSAKRSKALANDYEDLLGADAGRLIDLIKTRSKNLTRRCKLPTEQEVAGAVRPGVADQVAGVYPRVDQAYYAVVLAHYEANAGAPTPEEIAQAEATCKALKRLVEVQTKAQVSMVETAQGVDLYMRAFTEGMQLTATEIDSLSKITSSINFIAEWFNAKSASAVGAAFDSLRTDADRGAAGAAPGAAGVYRNVDGRPVAQVPDVYAAATGEAFGANYAGVLPANVKEVDAVMSVIVNGLRKVQALQNLVAIFGSIGSKWSKLNPKSKTFMRHKDMYDNLIKYMAASAISRGMLRSTGPAVGLHIDHIRFQLAGLPDWRNVTVAPLPADAVDVPNHFDHAVIEKPRILRATAGAQVAAAGTRAARVDDFAVTDMLFELTVKSMVAKITTIVTMYRINQHALSAENRHINGSLGATRTILGGASGGAEAEIIPGAMDLYMRLPLLAEWYRELFDFRDPQGAHAPHANDAFRVTMVPSVNGIWSEFVKLIFRTTEHVDQGRYSDQQVKEIVQCINKIYKAKGSGKDATMAVVNDFIQEVNRLYGFIKQEDVNAYLEDEKSNMRVDEAKRLGQPLMREDVEGVIDILSQQDEAAGAGGAPSDRFRRFTDAGQVTQSTTRSGELYKALIEFRKRMDLKFKEAAARRAAQDPTRNAPQYHFTKALRMYRKQIKAADGNSQKYKIVQRAIQGAAMEAGEISDRYLMLHETVFAPLAALRSIFQLLRGFGQFAASNDAAGRAAPFIQAGSWLGDVVIAAHNDQDLVRRDVLRWVLLFAARSDGLVSVNSSVQGGVFLDFSGIEDRCKALVAQVKARVGALRNEIPETVLAQVLDKNSVGSLPWLEDMLLDQAISDRDKNGLGRCGQFFANAWLRATNNGEAADTGAFFRARIASVGAIASRNNDARTFPFNILGITDRPLSELTTEQKTALHEASRGANLIAAEYQRLVPVPAIQDVAGDASGLMWRLNDLIQQYLAMGFDDTSQKIYAPLFESFASGVGSGAVQQSRFIYNVTSRHALPAAAGAAAVEIGNGVIWGEENSVLLQSVALTIRALMTATEPNVGKKFQLNSIADMEDSQKNVLKANLPIFIRQFRAFEKRCEIISKLVGDAVGLELEAGDRTLIRDVRINGNNADDKELHLRAAVAGDASKSVLTQQLTLLKNYASSIRSCAQHVYQELTDNPVYFETYTGSLVEYKRNNGSAPLTLPSSILHPLYADVGAGAIADRAFLPQEKGGSDHHKFNFAVRSLLQRDTLKHTVQHMPDVAQLVDQYNSMTQFAEARITAAQFADLAQQYVELARLAIDARTVNPVLFRDGDVPALAPYVPYVAAVAAVPAAAGAPGVAAVVAVPGVVRSVFAAGRPISALVALVEGSEVDAAKREVSAAVGMGAAAQAVMNPAGAAPVAGAEARRAMRVDYILDMDVVPIDVHAFMREVPFAHLLNYSYTMDRQAQDLILGGRELYGGAAMLPPARGLAGIADDRERRNAALAHLLCHPYRFYAAGDSAALAAVLVPQLADGVAKQRFVADQLVPLAFNAGAPAANLAENPRFNSKLGRNVLWMTLLQNYIQGVISKQTTTARTRVVSGPGVSAANLVDYAPGAVLEQGEFRGVD